MPSTKLNSQANDLHVYVVQFLYSEQNVMQMLLVYSHLILDKYGKNYSDNWWGVS